MDDEQLIIEVENRTALYDTRHPLYKDNSQKEWMEIAEVLGTTADQCKNRWKNLRDVFVRINRRTQLPSGSVPHKEWKYRGKMSFLLPYVQPRRSSKRSLGSTPTDSDETPQSLADAEERPSCSPSPSTSGEGETMSPRETPSRRPARKRKSTGTPVEDRMSVLKQIDPTNPDYESYYFALSTVPMLTKLSSQRRRRAKREILRILDDLTDDQEAQERHDYPLHLLP
ncbi:uncharacterized protein FYW61_015127 [Anableps anableps]